AGIRLLNQPTDVVAGETFDVRVELLDAEGHRTGESGRPVSIAVSNTARVSGPVAVNTVGGVATFSGFAITSAGNAFAMTANTGSFSTTSAAFGVRAAAVSAARSSFFPDSIVFTTGVPTPIDFTFTDAFGNPIAGQPVSLSASRAGIALSPANGVTDEH